MSKSSNSVESHVFQSRNLERGVYDKSDRSLVLTFVNGRRYKIQMSPEIWSELKSKGGPFYQNMIRPYFPAKLMEDEHEQ